MSRTIPRGRDFGVWLKHGYFNLLKPARRPQSPKGHLAADALRQRRNGKFGKALKFNGSSDYLTAHDSESLDPKVSFYKMVAKATEF